MSQLFDVTTRALGASANFRSLRQNVVSANVANAETPGYVAKTVEFEGALERAILHDKVNGASDPDHFVVAGGAISRARADVYDNPEGNVTNDGNTVDMEREMATLQENALLYKAALNLINKKMGALRYATHGGNR